jgi:sigma-B regulation protein RsbU (phosphoserine phosphatase)
MRIRWKLLLVLLFISLTPVLVLRWIGANSMRELGTDLAESTREALIRRTGLELRTLVEEHARILRQQRDLVEMMLQVQASELEKRLAGASSTEPGRTGLNRFGSDTQISDGPRQRPGAMGRSLTVSYREQTVLRQPSSGQTGPAELQMRLGDTIPVYRSLAQKNPELVYWQMTALKNGLQTLYPAILSESQQEAMGSNRMGGMMNPSRTSGMMGGRMNPSMMSDMIYRKFKDQWYSLAEISRQITWSKPIIDPFTMQLVLTVSAPLYDTSGIFMGVTAIAVPVNVLLKKDIHFRRISTNMTSLLVRTQTVSGTDKGGIRIIARQQIQGEMHHHWRALGTARYLEVEDRQRMENLVADLDRHKTNVCKINYGGQESLAAYGSIDDYGTALLLIVPQKDLAAEADSIGTYVLNRTRQQIRLTRLLLAAVVLAVIALALVLSRSVTKNITRLAGAARLVASGDFSTRVRIQSGDEIGELGQTFNNMVPALKDRMDMKQSLDLAMEVQQNLLPQKMPTIKGLDIAGQSIYCDQTGGDLYDFLEVCCQNSNQIGIAVGDVSGHGISAALLMASVRAFLRSRVTQSGSMAQIIDDVNRLVAHDTEETGQFMTLFYIQINPGKKTLEWVRAGHDPAVFYDPATDKFEQLHGEGAALGVGKNINYQDNVKADLSSGQVLLIGTDGLWETRNPAGEMFGRERLKILIRKHSGLSAAEILSSILEALKIFRDCAKQEDDITLVVVKTVE